MSAVPLLTGCGSDEADAFKKDFEAKNAEARALVHAEGCANATGCAAAPLGVKACGGAREYLVYCRVTTDEARLLATLEEARRAEQRYNELTHAVSDCMLLLAPETFTAVGGTCAAGAQ